MKRILSSLFVLVVLAFLAWSWLPIPPASSQNAGAFRPVPDLEAGKQAYLDSCARCHGATGAGDGRDAKRIYPRPRRLSEGVFKFRTTASGTPPTDEDLFRTLTEGLPGSRMPEFQRLSEETRWQLVYYVKSLSPVFQDQKPEPIDLGKDPGPKKANLARGKELYTQLGCNACHGSAGRADGPSAPTLVDPWGKPVRPADLTQGWSYRSGSSPRDVLTRLMTGLDGTPMPSYAEATSTAEAWDLAYYVHSIQEKPHWSRTVKAVRAAGTDLPWQDAPRFDLRLAGSYYRGGEILPTTVPSVSAQAVHGEGKLTLRLTWHDPSRNQESLPDAAAVVFLPERRAQWTVGSLRGWPVSPELPPLETVYWAADRDAAKMASVRDAAELAGNADAGEALPTRASFSEGEWAWVITRPIPADQKSIRLGVMVWDGGNQEQGRRRANSSWVDLILE